MIQLLSTVVVAEGVVVFLLMINIPPFRKLLLKAIDKAKTNKGPAMIKTLAAVMTVILASSIFSISKIQARTLTLGAITPTDQILFKTHLLEASLMGYSLFLGLVIYRLHHFLQKIRGLKRNVDFLKSQLDDNSVSVSKGKAGKDMSSGTLDDEVSKLKKKLEKFTSDCQAMQGQVKSVDGNAKDIQKQADALILQYNQILQENQSLRNKLSASE